MRTTIRSVLCVCTLALAATLAPAQPAANRVPPPKATASTPNDDLAYTTKARVVEMISALAGEGVTDGQVLTGSGVPSDVLGKDGDAYVRTSNGALYIKAAGAWGSPVVTLLLPDASGASLTALNASSLASGTVANARLDATLAALAAIASAADKLPYFDGVDSWATTDFTTFGRQIVAYDTAGSLAAGLGLITTTGNETLGGQKTFPLIPLVAHTALAGGTALAWQTRYTEDYDGTGVNYTAPAPSDLRSLVIDATVTASTTITFAVPDAETIYHYSTHTFLTGSPYELVLPKPADNDGHYRLVLTSDGTNYFLADDLPVGPAAADVTVAATPSNYTAATPDVEAHLAGIDTAIASAGGGAPTTADYWVGTANGSLSAEVVVNSATSLAAAIGGETSGTGNFVRVTSPTLITPALGTPASGNFSSGSFTWPTFNQNTTGSAATLTNTRTIGGSNFNGSANVTSFPAPGAIGGTTPSTGAFTTISATTSVTSPSYVVSITADGLSDDTYTGATLLSGKNAGATIAQWDLVYLNSSGNWVLCDADAGTPLGITGVIGLAIAAGTNGNPLTVLVRGFVRNDGWAWTAGSRLYMSGTAGGMTHTAPSTATNAVAVVGAAITDDEIWFDGTLIWAIKG